MRILYLSFYFEPDLGPAAIRNSLIANELANDDSVSEIHVITTMPQQWRDGFIHSASGSKKLKISRVEADSKYKGILGQIFRFYKYQKFVRKSCRSQNYDLVFATSSKLGTALLGALLSKKLKAYYYLDIRDLFIETIDDFLPGGIFKPVKFILSGLNRYSINKAHRINVLSTSFIKRLSQINSEAKISSIYHGVDSQFLNVFRRRTSTIDFYKKTRPHNKTLLYAGNFGFGQGLDTYLPAISSLLPPNWQIHLYGDGPKKNALVKSAANLKNVKLFSVVERNELPEIYSKADMLFLTLNSKPAFQSSLPSKIFEYCATGKPVIAFCSGQLQKFILEHNLEGVYAIKPHDLHALREILPEMEGKTFDRALFYKKWRREEQVKLLVNDVISLGLG
jgi:glycosyltransferase involved in cell wall biosynthesis